MMKAALQPRFPAVGEESMTVIQNAIHAALSEHGKAGRSVVVWREGKAVETRLDQKGNEVDEA